MCVNRELFINFSPSKSTVDGCGTASVRSIGDVVVKVMVKEEVIEITFINTLYVPNLLLNLISLPTLDLKRYYISIEFKLVVKSRVTGKTIMQATMIKKLYILQRAVEYDDKQETRHLALVGKPDLKLWHERLGHIGTQRFLQMKSGTAIGIDFSPTEIAAFECKVCTLGNAHKAPIYNKSPKRASMSGEKLHWDTCGPMEVPTLCGKRYIVVAVDDHSCTSFVHFCAKKSEAHKCIMDTITLVERIFGIGTVKCIHSDGGGEFTSNAFKLS
jgi:hypothetical protein